MTAAAPAERPDAPAPVSDPSPVDPPAADARRFGEPGPAGPHPLTRRRVWLPIALLVAVLGLPFVHLALRGEAPVTASVPFRDDFNRTELGEHYFATGGFWRPLDGWLYSPGVKNNPLWLQASLPRDAVVEFDARSDSGDGDIKAEIFGNGRDHASGYVLVFGGWKNTTSIIARLDEHGRDRVERKDVQVERGRTYRWRIERKGRELRWFIDGQPFLTYDDPRPLEGPGHDRFAFGTWVTDAYFDNLSVRALP